MAFAPKRFSKGIKDNSVNNINEDSNERHPHLGYLLNAPLPYCLSLEEIYGELPKLNEKELDPYDFNTETTKVLNQFLRDEIGTNGEGVRPSMDEYTFVKSYLPKFYHGHLENYNDKTSKTEFSIAAAWKFSITNNPYQSVDIVRNGEVIYRIPPLLSRLDVDQTTGGTDSLTVTALEAQDKINVIPTTKDMHIANLLNNYSHNSDLDELLKDKIILRNLKNIFVLDEIFTYYGYDSILTPKIMSIKSTVMGENNGNQSIRPVSSVSSGNGNTTTDEWDDDDLFG